MHNHWGKVKMKGKLTLKLGCKCCVAFNGKHKINNSKSEIKKQVDEFLDEYYGKSEDVKNDPYIKSLFPNATSVEVYYHYILGYDVLVVDGEYLGDYADLNELLAFHYHCGIPYSDYDDLLGKYLDTLCDGRGSWWFLP